VRKPAAFESCRLIEGSGLACDLRAPAQRQSPANARALGRKLPVLTLDSLGINVTTQIEGLLVLFSTMDRTRPVTADPPDQNVAVRPLNCAIRKRRTSFWSAVSKVIIELSCARMTIAVHRYSSVKIRNRKSTVAARAFPVQA
jgi:hypothetical protein